MITLTPEESRQFGALFAHYDPQGAGKVSGEVAYQLFIKSGLSTDVLRQVWNVADADNNGSLDLQEFAKAMRMIYHLQKGKPFGTNLATIPAMLPKFEPEAQAQAQVQAATAPAAAPAPVAVAAPATAPATTPVASPAVQTTGTPAIPALGTADKARFGSLFDKHAKNGLLDGPSARDIFNKANLDQTTLTKIWQLVDVRHIGSLRRNEFVLAMHLIQSSLNGSLAAIPSSLPSQWHPWLEGKATYTINPRDKQKFDSHFQGLQKEGVVDAESAAGFLTKSGLSEDVLAVVWDLADYQERGYLDQTGFSIAMFLVNRKLQGGELPSTTPAELIESASVDPGSSVGSPASPASRTFSPIQRSYSGQVAQARSPVVVQNSGQAPVQHQQQHQQQPQRQAQPSSRQVSGSMSDLMNLDDAFFGDVKTPVLSPNASGVPTKEAFVPKSSFGQSLVSGPSHKEVSAKVQESRSTYNELGQKLESTQALNKSTQEELKALEAEKQQLDKEISSLRTIYDQTAANVYRLQQQVKSTKEEMQRLEKDHNLRKSGLTALEAQHRDLSGQLDALRAQTEAHTAATAELEQQHATHTRNLEQLSLEQQEHEAQHREHTDRQAALQSEIEQLSGHLSVAHNSRSETEERSRNARQQSETLTQQLEQLRSELSAAQHTTQQAEAEAKAHEAVVQQRTQELESLKQQRQREYEAQQQHQKALQASKQRQSELEQHQRSLEQSASAESAGHSAAIGAGAGAAAGVAAGVATGAIASVVSSGHAESPQQPATIVDGPIGGVSANEFSSSIETSPQTSYKGTTISNRSSPRTSEFQMPQTAVPPSFTLPMARPQSASSSVQNNPPLSVRGDTEDVSIPVSPEFATTEPVSGIVPPESLEIADANSSRLYAHSGKSSDSFEFVDANDGEAPRQRSASQTIRAVDDSSDDEGPEELPVMPHAVYSRDAHAPTNAKYSGASPSSVSAKQPQSAQTHAQAPPMPAQPSHDDFGDAFDDLQEAEVSDDDFGYEHGQEYEPEHEHQAYAAPSEPPFSSPFAQAQSQRVPEAPTQSGPSEWQQLFADQADKPLPAPPQEPVSPAVTELMQMGFPKERAIEALRQCDNNPSEAINLLLDD